MIIEAAAADRLADGAAMLVEISDDNCRFSDCLESKLPFAIRSVALAVAAEAARASTMGEGVIKGKESEKE